MVITINYDSSMQNESKLKNKYQVGVNYKIIYNYVIVGMGENCDICPTPTHIFIFNKL